MMMHSFTRLYLAVAEVLREGAAALCLRVCWHPSEAVPFILCSGKYTIQATPAATWAASLHGAIKCILTTAEDSSGIPLYVQDSAPCAIQVPTPVLLVFLS